MDKLHNHWLLEASYRIALEAPFATTDETERIANPGTT